MGVVKENNARSKGDLENTVDDVEVDTELLANLKKRCATLDKDWAARSKENHSEAHPWEEKTNDSGAAWDALVSLS